MNKMQAYILNKIPEDSKQGRALKLLYEGTLQGKAVNVQDLVVLVRDYKFNLKSHNIDTLMHKMQRYSNNGAWARHKQVELNEAIFENNYVSSPDKHISVEIECILPGTKAIFIKNIASLGLRKNVCYKDDGSIKMDCPDCAGDLDMNKDEEASCSECNSQYDYQSVEVVLTAPRSQIFGVLMAVCGVLKQSRAVINKTCGLHVHFDMRNQDEVSVNKLSKKLARYVTNLKKVLPSSRRNNSFIKTDLATISSQNRYAFINASSYRKHRTIEIRGHSGTIDATKIINWILLLELLINSGRADKNSFFQMLSDIECPNNLYDYYHARFAKFKGHELENLTEFNTSSADSFETEESEIA